MALQWDDVEIITDEGKKVMGKAPVIISASRSTDIPAFYSKWLANRIDKGYIVWYNPFNRSKPYYISFKKARVFVFWSKNLKPLIPYLHKFDELGFNYYFQYSLNDYEKENLEPNVPSLKNRIETFKNLSSLIGKEKVIWRFDPLIVSKELPPRELLKRIWNIGNQIKGFTDKLVFSFVDVKAYKKVQNNLVKQTSYFDKENVHQAELTKEQINEVVEGLYKIKLAWANNNWDIEFATCCEDVNLEQYGIIHNKCIDDDLMRNLFPKDKELMFFLKYGELPNINKRKLLQKKLKDTGQRKICGCIFSKDIGMYNTCPHHCVYCYANTSQKIVEENFGSHSPYSEGIISI